MRYYLLEPEVAGGFGQNTILDPSVRPPLVTRFHYEFDGWLGDPIVESVACFIITESLKNKICSIEPSGVSFGNVEVSKSSEFNALSPDKELPNFLWLKVSGIPGKDDFGLSSSHRLVISQRILDIMMEFGLSHCDITEFKSRL